MPLPAPITILNVFIFCSIIASIKYLGIKNIRSGLGVKIFFASCIADFASTYWGIYFYGYPWSAETNKLIQIMAPYFGYDLSLILHTVLTFALFYILLMKLMTAIKDISFAALITLSVGKFLATAANFLSPIDSIAYFTNWLFGV